MSTPPDDLPDDKFRPESILDPYRAEIARLRGLLVKACVKLTPMLMQLHPWLKQSVRAIEVQVYIEREYGIRLRWNGETFEEDTTK